MTKKSETKMVAEAQADLRKAEPGEVVNLAKLLSRTPIFGGFRVWLVGDTPLICHAWSEKARREMLQKQVKAPKAGREARDPKGDFESSLYEMGDGTYGFPVAGVKNAILSGAHKDKGIPKTAVMSALWLDAQMVRTRPALAGAVCDMPLVRVYGTKPEMREDMVRVGAGLNKTASLAYRGQFRHWAILVKGRLNESVVNVEQLIYLLRDAGMSSGLGEWRNERRGMFGAFHLGDVDEDAAWTAFAEGKGPMPVPADLKLAAE